MGRLKKWGELGWPRVDQRKRENLEGSGYSSEIMAVSEAFVRLETYAELGRPWVDYRSREDYGGLG